MMSSSVPSLPCALSDHHGFEGSAPPPPPPHHVDDGFDGILASDFYKDSLTKSPTKAINPSTNDGGNNDGLTRDFLGLRAISQGGFLDMAAGLHHHPTTSSPSSPFYKQKSQNGTLPWQ